MPDKLIVRIFGGLGNQLFCYSAARRLALVNGAELVIDNVSGFKFDHKYKRHYQLDKFHIPCRLATTAERLEPFSRIRRFIKKRIYLKKPFKKRLYITQEGIDFDLRLLDVRFSGIVYMEGYWQSEKYFKDIEELISKELSFKKPDDSDNKKMRDEIISKNSIAIHLRFFRPAVDKESNDTNASKQYYQRALDFIRERYPDAHYFIFSDRPETAAEMIPLSSHEYTVVNHNRGDKNAAYDMWLMSLCNHFIIANSTFSWWGAWLSKSPNKTVIAPKHVSREGVKWGFDGLLPESWTKL